MTETNSDYQANLESLREMEKRRGEKFVLYKGRNCIEDVYSQLENLIEKQQTYFKANALDHDQYSTSQLGGALTTLAEMENSGLTTYRENTGGSSQYKFEVDLDTSRETVRRKLGQASRQLENHKPSRREAWNRALKESRTRTKTNQAYGEASELKNTLEELEGRSNYGNDHDHVWTIAHSIISPNTTYRETDTDLPSRNPIHDRSPTFVELLTKSKHIDLSKEELHNGRVDDNQPDEEKVIRAADHYIKTIQKQQSQ